MAIPFRGIFTFFTRFIAIGFLVVAALTLPQAWRLTKSEYTRDGNTLYIPLEICEPQTLNFDGEDISFDADQVGNCRTLDNIISACIAGIFFAMVAMLFFFVFELLARFKIGPVSHSSVLGMAVFQTFILLQCAACCWALYTEATYWTGVYERQLDAIGMGEISVKTHGNVLYLGITFIVALVAAALLLLDTILMFCCPTKPASDASAKQQNASNNELSQPTASFADSNMSSAEQQSIQQQESMIHESEPMTPESPANSPAWTNV